MSDDATERAGGPRARYTRRVTPEDVRRRVSVRYLTPAPDRGAVPTDVVGRLLGLDDEAMLVVDRAGRLHVIAVASVLASRTVPDHPRLPAEPDVGTRERPLRRLAARTLVLDPRDRVLLVAHAPDAGSRVWTAPGGGLEPEEDPRAAAGRELGEEIGIAPAIGPVVWRRRVTFPFRSVWIDQDERWFLARVDEPVDPASAPLVDAGTLEAAWWTLEELRGTGEALAPANLAEHLHRLLAEGPPAEAIDVGR